MVTDNIAKRRKKKKNVEIISLNFNWGPYPQADQDNILTVDLINYEMKSSPLAEIGATGIEGKPPLQSQQI